MGRTLCPHTRTKGRGAAWQQGDAGSARWSENSRSGSDPLRAVSLSPRQPPAAAQPLVKRCANPGVTGLPPGAEKRCGRPGHCTVSSAQRRRGAGRHLWPGPGSAAAGGGTAPRPGPRPGRGVGSEEALGSGGLPALRVWMLQEGLGTEVGLC